MLIDDTPFSTATANRDATGIHTDGNNPGGYGVMTLVSGGEFVGGTLVFPRYGVGVDIPRAAR